MTWTSDQIDFLIKNYSELGAVHCSVYLNRKPKAVNKKARSMGLNVDGWNYWTSDEIEKLRFHWQHSDMKTLLEAFPNREYQSLMNKAQRLKIKSLVDRSRKGDLTFLNNLNSNSAYWWGFIMGDGCITDDTLVVGIHKSDEDHLRKLATHLKTTIHRMGDICVGIRIGDKKTIQKWRTLFRLTGPKTYYPPLLTHIFESEFLLEFLIGLIDADGHLRTQKTNSGRYSYGSIELHGNWLPVLTELSDVLSNKYGLSVAHTSSKKGTSLLRIRGNRTIGTLRMVCQRVDYLERKWSQFDFLLK